jgi:hypothetical protein
MEGPYFRDLAGNIQSLQIIGGCESEPQETEHLARMSRRCMRPDEFRYQGGWENNGLSLDLDAIKDFKTCNYHVGVMTYDEIRPIIEQLRGSKIIEISEFNPDNGYDDYEKNIIDDLLNLIIKK